MKRKHPRLEHILRVWEIRFLGHYKIKCLTCIGHFNFIFATLMSLAVLSQNNSSPSDRTVVTYHDLLNQKTVYSLKQCILITHCFISEPACTYVYSYPTF